MTKEQVKYRITRTLFGNFIIEKYSWHPDGPDDYNGMPESLAGFYWTKCTEYDVPDLYAKLNAD